MLRGVYLPDKVEVETVATAVEAVLVEAVLVEAVVAGSLFHKHHEAYRALVKCLLDQSVAGVGLAYHTQRLNLKILVINYTPKVIMFLYTGLRSVREI